MSQKCTEVLIVAIPHMISGQHFPSGTCRTGEYPTVHLLSIGGHKLASHSTPHKGDLRKGGCEPKAKHLKKLHMNLLHTCSLQHGSEGLLTLTSTKPGALQITGFTSGHFLGLQITDLLALSQIHSSQLYSKTSLNCHKIYREFSLKSSLVSI